MLSPSKRQALMPVYDARNILHIGLPKREGDPEITAAMAEAVCKRIEEAGGKLIVWAVLHEDVYETRYGDGFYLHLYGLAQWGHSALA